MADEHYLVPNARATMPLERFLDGDSLALLSEGPPLLSGPLVPQGIPGVPPTPPDGYLHRESDIAIRSPLIAQGHTSIRRHARRAMSWS